VYPVLQMPGVWAPRKPVSKSNQDPLSESSHKRCRRRDGLEVTVHNKMTRMPLLKNANSMAALELWQ